MNCPRCSGLLVPARDQTLDGKWCGTRCPMCGYLDDPVMQRHKLTRPEPFRTVPLTKAKRPDLLHRTTCRSSFLRQSRRSVSRGNGPSEARSLYLRSQRLTSME